MLSSRQRLLVEEHLSLVPQVLARVAAHYPRHADREELAQAARLGLVEAAARYEDDRGVPFASWATMRVRGAILDAVRALDFAPRNLRSAEREAGLAREELARELGRTPTIEELAGVLGLTVDQLVRLEGRVHRSLVLSLDAPFGVAEGQPVTLATHLVDQVGLGPLEVLEERERASYVRDALACLPERLQDVVLASYVDGESLVDIARRLSVTESRVSQMRGEALALMRDAIALEYGERLPTQLGKGQRKRLAYAKQVAVRSSYETRLSALPRPRAHADDESLCNVG